MTTSILPAPLRFKNPEFGALEMIEEDDKFFFAGTDAARMLGYTNPWTGLCNWVD